MSEPTNPWNPEQVRSWLESRFAASRLDQAAADRRGYDAQDDFDKAAAEEWVCRALKSDATIDDQAAFARRIKELIAQDEYPMTGLYDDRKFERHVRAALRKLAKMTKGNEGFANKLRWQ